LRSEAQPIPDTWSCDTVKPGHEIGKAAYLFGNIKPEKGDEWREMFGSDEVKKAKAEAAEAKAKKKEAMRKQKEAKKAKKAEGAEVEKEGKVGGGAVVVEGSKEVPDEGKETIYVHRPKKEEGEKESKP
ncbi:hypothetical protein IMZ48_20820, partial [Candidatus Bathyarchaeota archaeon]|nr:hypothetical protein [Candidatus Bathyarchaeota archaeon]